MSGGKGAFKPLSAHGGVRGCAPWDGNAGCPNANWPGLSGLVGGWARLTKSSPNESDSLSDSGGHTMVPELIVSTLFLLQGIKFLQISHHEKF